MNKLESEIHYAPLPMPEAGTLQAVAEGVYWLRMPLPFALDHINLWLIEDTLNGREGFTAVDTGISDDTTKALWQVLAKSQFKGRPLLRVVCTHMHPDHVGLAHWLCQGMPDKDGKALFEAPLPLAMTLGEYANARLWSSRALTEETRQAPDAQTTSMAEHFRRHGMTSREDYAKAKKRDGSYASMVPSVPLNYQRLLPNKSLKIGGRDWEIIIGYGHSPEHAALFCKDLKLLISGDMVLPRISTNMSVWATEPDSDPLGLYLESLGRFEPLPEDCLVLPSHGKPFGGERSKREGGLHTRLRQLHEHHEERLSEALAFCKDARTAAQVLPILFPRALDFHQFTFAMGETLAHLNRLWHGQALSREIENGIFYFKAC
jgi:glyoxylase-like metal-dependent hydrolase (beta-lactamase superfamily II)